MPLKLLEGEGMNELRRTSKTYTLEEKKNICERWKTSVKNIRQFCEEQGIAVSTFYGWCSTLIPEFKKVKSNLCPVKIVRQKPMAIKEDEIEKTTIEITLSNQMLVSFKLPVKQIPGLIQELANAIAVIR